MSRNLGCREGPLPETSWRAMTREPASEWDTKASQAPADAWANSESTSDGEGHWLPAFPQFTSLPIEIRLQIWEHFCPDLLAKSRVYTIMLASTSEKGNITDGQMITQHTAAARATLATHRESRALALRAFPDTLAIRRGYSVLRFNKNVDLIQLVIPAKSYWFLKDIDPISFPGFFENIKHLAINPALFTRDIDAEQYPTSPFWKTLQQFPSLETLYLCSVDRHCEASELRWCASDSTHRFTMQNLIKKPSRGTDSDVVFCWPDLVQHRDFAERNVPVHEIQRNPLWYNSRLTSRFREAIARANASQTNRDIAEPVEGSEPRGRHFGIEVWPMISFPFQRGMQRFRAITKWTGVGEDWNSEDDDGKDD